MEYTFDELEKLLAQYNIRIHDQSFPLEKIYFLFKNKIIDNSSDSIYLRYVGHFYRYVEKNNDLTIKYYSMAAEQGDTDAMNSLAVHHIQNKIDNTEAIKYLLMAIDKNNEMAMYNMGSLCEKNEINYCKAKKYYLMAANMDLVTAISKINSILKNDFDPVFAVKCYQFLDEINLYLLNKFVFDFINIH